MPDEDDDLARGRQRASDQQEASESRQRKFIAKISAERRDEFWLDLGFNVSKDSGLDRLRATLGLPAALGIEVSKDNGLDRLRATLALPEALGINVMDPDDVKKKREVLAWAERAQERAATFGKRLLLWLSTGIGLLGGTMGIIKYLMDWRQH